ncbi:pyruvate kinase [Microbaculum marinum]|uniref:Pyruvate kinase n=1 Tax=Microbaculum marinum TaxID=1764581 RepID=A0AAW9RJB3_9HYPH
MRRKRSIKILATLGPATSEEDRIAELFEAGADVFRINMSHTPHKLLKSLHGRLRAVEARFGRPIGILCDLQGPKLRIGTFSGDGADLVEGDTFVLDTRDTPGDGKRVYLPHPPVFEAAEEGHRLLLDDGRIRLRVVTAARNRLECVVEVGGKLTARKGVSLPDTLLPFGAMTDKDRADLDAALNLGVDWVALSFVQRPDDLAEARKMTRGRAAIMAKIEKPQAVQRLDEIIEMADGLMVARGDLGVEMPLEAVPGVQKRITRAGRRAGKPVVVATQMLESMISAPVPTRAEVSDVATAVFEGADAIMLSAESAVGDFPVEAVATMNRIAERVETDANFASIINAQRADPEATGPDAISAAARTVSDTLKLPAIVCYTSSGATGLRAARERPDRPIIALSPNPATSRRLALVWGLHCVLTEDAHDENDMVDRACRIAQQEGFAKPGQRIIVTAGVPFGTPGATNMLRIAFVGDAGTY